MVLRAILPVALIAFLFNGSLRAETPKLPSTKAGVVIPLLEKFSPTGRSPAEEVKETKKILGDNCHCEIGHSDEDPLRQCYYFLDDGTQVEVVSSKKYFSILIFFHGQGAKIIYPK
jgi:hypothetical protein